MASPTTPERSDGSLQTRRVSSRRRRTWMVLAAISIGWKVLVFTLGAALPRWLITDGIDELPAASQPYAAQARATALALWNGPLERRGLVQMVRVESVESVESADTPGGTSGVVDVADSLDDCNGLSARVRAYTYFAIPYSEVRTHCDRGVVEYRVFRRRRAR